MNSSPIGVIIGGAAGGVAVVLLVGVAIVALCVMVIKCRQKKEYRIEENEGLGYGNAIYQGNSCILMLVWIYCLIRWRVCW